jgi:hypothetical protein
LSWKRTALRSRVGKNPGFFLKSPARWVYLGFIGVFWVLLGFIGVFWVLLGFIGVFSIFVVRNHKLHLFFMSFGLRRAISSY